MSKVLWNFLLISPVALAATVAVSASTIAAEIQAQTEVAQADAPTEFSMGDRQAALPDLQRAAQLFTKQGNRDSYRQTLNFIR